MTNAEAAVFFAKLAETDANGKAKLPKAEKIEGVCYCGCGGTTKGRFVPGHDARLHSLAKQCLRGEADQDEALESLPHDAAREEFLAYQEKVRPVEEAKAKAAVAIADAKRLAKEAKGETVAA